jgi:hypothetical protein
VSTFPIKHSQLLKVPDSKSRLGGQEDWLYALENKHTIIQMQVTALTIIKRVKRSGNRIIGFRVNTVPGVISGVR